MYHIHQHPVVHNYTLRRAIKIAYWAYAGVVVTLVIATLHATNMM